MANPRHYAALMTTVNKEMESLQPRLLEYEAADKLWQAAVVSGDGEAEQERRLQLHASLDQLLDLRSSILQLVKRATL